MSQKSKLPLSSVSMTALGKFKDLDKSKYANARKPKKLSRSQFDNGLDQINVTFG